MLGQLGASRSGHAPVAYTLVPTEDGTKLYAVELLRVRFDDVRFLEPNKRADRKTAALARLERAAFDRTRKGTLGWRSKHFRKV